MEKMPRQYADDYFSAQSKDAQRMALQGCPAEWQEIVKTHIRIKRERVAHDNTIKNHK